MLKQRGNHGLAFFYWRASLSPQLVAHLLIVSRLRQGEACEGVGEDQERKKLVFAVLLSTLHHPSSWGGVGTRENSVKQLSGLYETPVEMSVLSF